MSFNSAPTPAQIVKLQQNWQRISRVGMPAFIFAAGSLMLVWMVLCFFGVTYLTHATALIYRPFFLVNTLPLLALTAYAFPAAYYLMLKKRIQNIGTV